MMKKEYQTPEIEITKFGTQDCITASPGTSDNVDYNDSELQP